MENNTEKYFYLTPDGTIMFVVPKTLLEKYSYEELTGGIAKNQEDFERGTKLKQKEPNAPLKVRATYDLIKLQKFLKVAKTIGATHVTISLETDEPMRITATNDEGETITFWIAPFIED